MPKLKYTPEFRSIIFQEYLDGKGSYQGLSKKYNIGKATIQKWVTAYHIHGIKVTLLSSKYHVLKKSFRERGAQLILLLNIIYTLLF